MLIEVDLLLLNLVVSYYTIIQRKQNKFLTTADAIWNQLRILENL